MELEYEDGAAWNVSSVTQSEGMLILLRHTPHVLAETPDLLDRFQRAASRARCYAGRRTDAGKAADEILRLTDVRP